MRVILPPVLTLICLILMSLLRWLSPIAIIFPKPWSWLGILPICTGLMLGLSGVYQFRKAKTNIRPFREADTLVMSGIFRFTRNPMYFGIALLLAGVWVLLGALSPVIGIIVFVVVADRWYIQVEERMLSEKFGPAFEDYRVRVRRWI